MITTAQAAKKAQELGKQLKAVIEVGEVLEELGDLEQAKAELQRAIVAAQEAQQLAESERVIAQSQLQQTNTSLVGLKADIRQRSHDSQQRFEHTLATARAKATQIIGTATVAANKVLEEATASVRALEKQRDTLKVGTAQLKADFISLRTQLDELRERLD